MNDPWLMARVLVQAGQLSPQSKARAHQSTMFRGGGPRLRPTAREKLAPDYDWQQVSEHPREPNNDLQE